MPRALTLPLLLTALLAGPLAAQGIALKADSKEAIEVTADALGVSQADGSATFSGNVVIAQGAMRLSAGKVVVVYAGADQSRISRLTATGGVTLATADAAAEAQQADYDVAGGKVTLRGDVLLTQGKNILAGETMVVDLASGRAEVQGRVRSVIQPGGN